MRTLSKLSLLFFIASLTFSTGYLWMELHRLRMLHHTLAQSFVKQPIAVTEVRKGYVKLSNKSSDVVYEPALPNGSPYKLIIISLSSAKYNKRRSAVRETWNKRLNVWNMNYDQILHYFICFTPKREVIKDDLLLEATNHQDIVIFSDNDMYSQLAVQTLSALDWLESKFEFDYVLKTDDDALVNIDLIYKWLEGKDDEVYGGRSYSRRTPTNDAETKWALEYYGKEEFRVFCPGAGYVLGRGAVRKMLPMTSHIRLTAAEDVYVGEVMGQVGIHITHLPAVFPIWQEYCQKSDERFPQWSIIHWLDPERMVRFWKRLSSEIGGCDSIDKRRAKQQSKSGAFSRN